MVQVQKRKVSALAISDSRLTRFSAKQRKTADAKPDDKNQRVELPYPESIKPAASSRATAACYQDFVDIFCKAMWAKPDMDLIVDSLRVAFKSRQDKYGKNIVPDVVLDELLHEANLLPEILNEEPDLSFAEIINSAGWHIVKNVISKHEALLIALMSISCYNWSIICNRHGWTLPEEKKQNRYVAFLPFLLIDFSFSLGGWRLLKLGLWKWFIQGWSKEEYWMNNSLGKKHSRIRLSG